jgi:putative transposase
MSELFNNTYRITSARLQSWNYIKAGMYFVTVCTKNRASFFGRIIEAMNKNDASSNEKNLNHDIYLEPTIIDKVAYEEWFKTPQVRSDMNIELGEFIVMPNHIHGILLIGENAYNASLQSNPENAKSTASTTHDLSEYKNQFGRQAKNLASIIRGYKSAVTIYARKCNLEFDWQSGFYEHIIRSVREYESISNYIVNNPISWKRDKFYCP